MLLLAAIIYYTFSFSDGFGLEDSFNDIEPDWDYED
jgi:hypothetical protein